MRIGPRLFWSALFLAWAGGLVFVCARFSFSTLLFNLASLFLGGSEYTIRSGFFLQLSQSGRLLGYITGQIGEAIDPFLIAYGMVHKRKWPLAAGIVGQVAIFTVVGAKSIFFSTFFLVIVLWMARRYARNFGIALGSLLIAIVLLSAGVDSYSKTANLSSITTRRTLMDPGLLTGFYYEHYSQAPYAGWSYHFPKPGESILAPPYEIGLVYMGDANIEANANLWAQGFGDFGMSGIAGFTLLLAAMLWIYDSIAARQNREFAIVLVAMQAFAYSNSPPMTVFLTHGGLATALLLWTAPFIRPARVESEAASMR
jgi:hypothetical protein